MCLILFSAYQHPKYKFILAANRDEFYNRPAAAAEYWKDNPNILGGRDTQSEGTWLGINKNGRFIALTNYRDPNTINPKAISRGKISFDFLNGTNDVFEFLDEISKKRKLYNGFNLLLSDDGLESLYHYSNITDKQEQIMPGIHGLSNHLLDTPWPKVEKGKYALTELSKNDNIETSDLIDLLKDHKEAEENMLPNTGISFDLEKKLSPVFISMNGYGTRCSTAILLDRNRQLTFQETSYDEKMHVIQKKAYRFIINS